MSIPNNILNPIRDSRGQPIYKIPKLCQPIKIDNADGSRDIQTVIMLKMAAKGWTVRKLCGEVGFREPKTMAKFLNRTLKRSISANMLLHIFQVLNIHVEGWRPDIIEHPKVLEVLKSAE